MGELCACLVVRLRWRLWVSGVLFKLHDFFLFHKQLSTIRNSIDDLGLDRGLMNYGVVGTYPWRVRKLVRLLIGERALQSDLHSYQEATMFAPEEVLKTACLPGACKGVFEMQCSNLTLPGRQMPVS